MREVLEGGAVPRDELNRRVARFRQVVVLRPDGYLAWVLSARVIEGLRRFYSQPKWRFLLDDFEAAVKFTLEAK